MLDVFKIKPFDLEPIYASWTDGPTFTGNPKKDPSVDDWLEEIRLGCVKRNVPEEYWHKVAQHFMGPKAKARFNEVKAVVAKKFKIAMKNMGWGIDSSATETIKVEGKSTGLWWIARKKSEKEIVTAEPIEDVPKPGLARSGSSFWSSKKSTRVTKMRPCQPPVPTRSNTADSTTITTTTQAPVWLLNACTALDFITSEHPKAMSVLSAILITAGSLPAIPAISAGAGGAILASGAAHAIGAIAVGLGQALSSSVRASNRRTNRPRGRTNIYTPELY
ncbi:hypothetical protein BD779DRAFT_1612380 [Infundibulicybe gibba]|nr:hypothetical protein BD779DRAFT_1612380 [Infundibulicybe gibba]